MRKNIHDLLKNFSLVLGGPLYQLYLRIFLVKPSINLCYRRIVVISMFAWLPLLLLSIIGGTAFSGSKVPFIFDIDTQVRFLGSLSILIAAEVLVHKLIPLSVMGFDDHEIISLKTQPKFDKIIASSIRLRNSVVVELLLIIIVFSAGHWIWKEYGTLNVGTWCVALKDHVLHLTPAGYWYTYVSLPIFQFILLRWYFRIFVWYRFLWKVSRLPLRLNSLHPDKAGGLGFLVNSAVAFAPVLLAHTILLAGMIANRIWHEGATLTEFKFEIIGILLYLMLMAFSPLTFFFAHLVQAKRNGLREYGIVASHYVNTFYRKWINNADRQHGLLGTADIQSLADLSTSFDVVQEMRSIPFSWRIGVQLLILTSAPFAPLILTTAPIEDIFTSLIKVIL